MIKISFDARTLKAALVCVSSDETRYYLKGVAVQLDGDKLFIAATDGHRLLAMQPECEITRDDTDANDRADFGSVIIPVDIVKNLKLSRYVDTCILTIDGGKGEIEHCGQSVLFKFIDGSFPNWRNVIPKTITGELAQFDAKYVGELPKIKAAFGDKNTKIAIEHNGGDPAFVALALPIPYICLLMPYRDRNPLADLPSWAKTARADQAIPKAA
jgi:DNA polymerase III beta subunit, central domain